MGDKLRDEALDDVATWRVDLVSGVPDEGGIISDTQYITKKWERVQDIIDRCAEQYRGERCYIQVTRLVAVDSEAFAMGGLKPAFVQTAPTAVVSPHGPNRQTRRSKK